MGEDGRSAEAALLPETLRRWIDEGRLRWPDLAVPGDVFAEYLLARFEPGVHASAQPLRDHVADLYLACACARGDPAAIAAFCIAHRTLLDRIFDAPRGPGKGADDLFQLLMARLFVAEPPRAPRIIEYRGRGSLRTWLRVVGMRVRLNAERGAGQRETALAASAEDHLADAWDAELEYLKASYREAFRAAFADAVAGLEPRERALLRLQVRHGMSATGIAGVFSVHRATAKRWLAAVRSRLLDATRANLRTRLRVATHELDEVMDVIGSRLEASVQRVLEQSEQVENR